MRKLPLILLSSLAASAASASVTLNLDAKINGTLPSSVDGTAPYLTAVFTNTMTPGTVRLTMTNNAPNGSALFVSDWLFNSLVAITGISHVSGNTASSATYGANSQTGANDIKGGKFDLLFSFPNNGADEFTAGETTVYDLTGAGLTESSFATGSIAGGSNNPGSGYFSAAKIQGFGASVGIGTKTQAVPEPTSMAALGLGAVALVRRRRKA